MRHVRWLLWILILFGALFFGPAVILERNASEDGVPLLKAIEQERLLDAPAPLPPSKLPQ